MTGQQWQTYPGWQWELAPFAPCRRPGCNGVARWQGVDVWKKHEGETEPLFCSPECEGTFWDTRELFQEELRSLLLDRRQRPDYWSTRRDAWDTQYNLAWWHLARYMGVRRHATDPDKAKWHEHYYAVGMMISRAGEWESMAEVTLSDLMDEPIENYRQLGASNVVLKFRANLERWPHLEQRVTRLCDAATPAINLRNWLVHSWVTPTFSGEGADLRKPIRGQAESGRANVTVEQTQRLTARFVWLWNATNRIHGDKHADERPTVFGEPLGPPPPIDYELTDEQLYEFQTARRMRARTDAMAGAHSAEVALYLAELRAHALALLSPARSSEADRSAAAVAFAVKADSEGLAGVVAAAVLCASVFEMLATETALHADRALAAQVFSGCGELGTLASGVITDLLSNRADGARGSLAQNIREGQGVVVARLFAVGIVRCVDMATALRQGQGDLVSTFTLNFFDGLGG